MLNTPFVGGFCCFYGCIIFCFFFFCKILLLSRLHDGPADLSQTHFSDVAGSNAQSVDGFTRIEIIDGNKVLRHDVGICRDG